MTACSRCGQESTVQSAQGYATCIRSTQPSPLLQRARHTQLPLSRCVYLQVSTVKDTRRPADAPAILTLDTFMGAQTRKRDTYGFKRKAASSLTFTKATQVRDMRYMNSSLYSSTHAQVNMCTRHSSTSPCCAHGFARRVWGISLPAQQQHSQPQPQQSQLPPHPARHPSSHLPHPASSDSHTL